MAAALHAAAEYATHSAVGLAVEIARSKSEMRSKSVTLPVEAAVENGIGDCVVVIPRPAEETAVTDPPGINPLSITTSMLLRACNAAALTCSAASPRSLTSMPKPLSSSRRKASRRPAPQ